MSVLQHVRRNQVIIVMVQGLRLVSLANQREHWSVRAKRTAKERKAIGTALMSASVPRSVPQGLCAHVHLVRIGKRVLDEDNLAGACKAVQDAVAKWLVVDDGDRERIVFTRSQETSKTYGVRVEIELRKKQ
jgi:hypothetical protein